jgi:hypothetical protein
MRFVRQSIGDCSVIAEGAGRRLGRDRLTLPTDRFNQRNLGLLIQIILINHVTEQKLLLGGGDCGASDLDEVAGEAL